MDPNRSSGRVAGMREEFAKKAAKAMGDQPRPPVLRVNESDEAKRFAELTAREKEAHQDALRKAQFDAGLFEAGLGP